jgi:hypothetical protein
VRGGCERGELKKMKKKKDIRRRRRVCVAAVCSVLDGCRLFSFLNLSSGP